jgi:SAM-dependent methyltransferase
MLLEAENRGGNETVQASKAEQVRTWFEETTRYLPRRRYEIAIRAETVRKFVADKKMQSILDIGCGDGSISVPLLSEDNGLTLVDLSSGMLEQARARVPLHLLRNVHILNEDFMRATLQPQSFDLILCIGVLAHVSSPDEFIARMVQLLKPGGRIIVEVTDAAHCISLLVWSLLRLWGYFRPTGYNLNRVAVTGIIEAFRRHQMVLVARFRYLSALPGQDRLFSQAALYKMVRILFGYPESNRNRWLGNECIYSFAAP